MSEDTNQNEVQNVPQPEIVKEEKQVETIEQKKPEQTVKKIVRPKLFRSANENIKVTVVGYYNGETGELEFALPEQDSSEEMAEDTGSMIIQKNTFVFSPVPYNRLNIYRKKSGQYNQIDKSTTVDFLKFRDFLWTFHLKSWDLKDENGNDVVITHDADGTLSDESQKKLWEVPSSILDIVIQVFENKLNII